MDIQEIAAVVISGQDHLISRTDLQGTQRQLDGKRTAAAGRDELDAVIFRQPIFQALDIAPLVLSPGSIAIGCVKSLPNVCVGNGPIRWSLRTNRSAAQDRRKFVDTRHGVLRFESNPTR